MDGAGIGAGRNTVKKNGKIISRKNIPKKQNRSIIGESGSAIKTAL